MSEEPHTLYVNLVVSIETAIEDDYRAGDELREAIEGVLPSIGYPASETDLARKPKRSMSTIGS